MDATDFIRQIRGPALELINIMGEAPSPQAIQRDLDEGLALLDKNGLSVSLGFTPELSAVARIVSPGEIRLGISALLTGIEHPALATLPPRPLLGALVHSATHMLLLNDQRRVAVVDAYATPRLSRLLRGCYAQHWAALQAGGDSILLAYPILANLPYALYPGEIGPLAAELYVSAPSVLAALEAVLDLDLVTPAQDVWGGSLPQGVVDNALEKSLAQALQPLVTDATPTPNPFRGDTTRGYRPWVGQAHWGGLEARGGDSEPGMLAFYRGLNLPRLALFWIAYGSRAC